MLNSIGTPARRGARGFTLLEVMVSVLVVAIGLLGVAKMQALALSSTQVSSSRSLVALQAGSLVSSMHGGREWWATSAVSPSFSVGGSTVTDAASILSASVPACTAAAPCTAAQLAAKDVQAWAVSMNALVMSHATAVTCTPARDTPPRPTSCVISVTWAEKTVASVNQPGSAPAASSMQTYVLYVEP